MVYCAVMLMNTLCQMLTVFIPALTGITAWYARKHQPSPNDFTTTLSGITSGNYLRVDDGTDIHITHEGIKSINKINTITLNAINIKGQGDINMINSTKDYLASSKFIPNDILFHKVIDTKCNNV